jgi:hypothetical protein
VLKFRGGCESKSGVGERRQKLLDLGHACDREAFDLALYYWILNDIRMVRDGSG